MVRPGLAGSLHSAREGPAQAGREQRALHDPGTKPMSGIRASPLATRREYSTSFPEFLASTGD
jgi:hypothetical protein